VSDRGRCAERGWISSFPGASWFWLAFRGAPADSPLRIAARGARGGLGLALARFVEGDADVRHLVLAITVLVTFVCLAGSVGAQSAPPPVAPLTPDMTPPVAVAALAPEMTPPVAPPAPVAAPPVAPPAAETPPVPPPTPAAAPPVAAPPVAAPPVAAPAVAAPAPQAAAPGSAFGPPSQLETASVQRPLPMLNREPLNETVALSFSLGATVVSWGLFVMGASEENGGAMGIGLVGTFLGPSMGHWYAGSVLTRGMAVRALGALSFGYGLKNAFCDCPAKPSTDPLIFLGMIAYVGATVDDIIRAPLGVRARNRFYGMALAPTVTRQSAGLALGGRF